MNSFSEKNNATHCGGGTLSQHTIMLDTHNRNPCKREEQAQNYPIWSIEDQAREFMLQHSIRYNESFSETGSIPIQFAGYEGTGEKRVRSSEKTERLFCSHLDDTNRQGLCISFRSWHASWGDQWITKTFWNNTGNFLEKDLQEFKRKQIERKEQDRKRLEEENNKSDQLADWCSELYLQASKEGISPYVARKKLKCTENIRYQTVFNSDTGKKEINILIPLYNFGGQIRALQIIYPDKRLFKYDDQKPRDKHFINKHSGCFFAFGILEDGKEIRICEGFSTASTVFELTESTTLAAMSRSNLKTVCEQLKERYKRSKIIICADNDLQTPGNPGLKDALDCSQNLGVKVAYPRFPDQELAKINRWNDFNDLYVYVENGSELAKNQLNELFDSQIIQEAIVRMSTQRI
ncbi:toprim domain-containing protein [Parachlamydia sp.]|uniref:toprim domain-containing protein n=1 Tax=Parachlamydia sp. TaxID=2052048 RepID=UPI003D09A1CE